MTAPLRSQASGQGPGDATGLSDARRPGSKAQRQEGAYRPSSVVVGGGSGGAAPRLNITSTSERISPRQGERRSPKTGPEGSGRRVPKGYRKPSEIQWMNACERNAWTIETWNKCTPGERKRFAFKCKSWRHSGECQRWKNAQDFARIKETLEPFGVDELVFVVLTWPGDKRGSDAEIIAAYKKMLPFWKELARRIRALACSEGWAHVKPRRGRPANGNDRQKIVRGKLRYIRTLEQQGDGSPHLNAIIVSRELADWVKRSPEGARRWLKDTAAEIGFGCQAFIDVARDKGKLTHYIVKHSGCTDRLPGEVAKLQQVPHMAPFGSRRIAASIGFLVKPKAKLKDDDITGTLTKQSVASIERGIRGEYEDPRPESVLAPRPSVELVQSLRDSTTHDVPGAETRRAHCVHRRDVVPELSLPAEREWRDWLKRANRFSLERPTKREEPGERAYGELLRFRRNPTEARVRTALEILGVNELERVPIPEVTPNLWSGTPVGVYCAPKSS